MGYRKDIREFEKQARKLELIMGGKMNTKEKIEKLERTIEIAMERIQQLEESTNCNDVTLEDYIKHCIKPYKKIRNGKAWYRLQAHGVFDKFIGELICVNHDGTKYKLSEDYDWSFSYDNGIVHIKPTKK